MTNFSNFIIESLNKTIKEVEKHILSLNPKKYVNKAKKADKISFYFANRPNLKRMAEQIGITDTYTKGSEYGILYEYSYYNASPKIKSYIDKSVDLSNNLKNLLIQVMVDDIVGKYYLDQNATKNVDDIKKEVLSAKTLSSLKKVLKKYDFKDIPDDKILKQMIGKEEYTQEQDDSYGHKTGIVYKYNFKQKRILSYGFSSDD